MNQFIRIVSIVAVVVIIILIFNLLDSNIQNEIVEDKEQDFSFSGKVINIDSLYQNVGLIELKNINQNGLNKNISFLKIDKDSAKILIMVQFIDKFSSADSIRYSSSNNYFVLYKNGENINKLSFDKVVVKRFSPVYLDAKKKLRDF